MRVAILGHYPVRPDWVLGGVEAVIAMLSAELSRDPELDVHVVTYRREAKSRPVEVISGGPTVHRLAQPRYGRITWHLAGQRRLRKTLKAIQPDLVHAHGSLVYTAAALGSGIPTVVTIHGLMALEAHTLEDPLKRVARTLDIWYERFALRRVGHFIAISPYVLRAFPWFRPRVVHHIQNPVDNGYFDVARDEEPLRILCPVRVIPRKGLLLALQALARIKDRFPGVQLRVAGETMAMPSYYRACQATIEEYSLGDQVVFLDNLDSERLAEEYERCALMLLPSIQETAPVVIGEAMAAGAPVVATSVGGVPDMVEDGVTGMLVEYGDAAGLASAMAVLLADPGLRREMGSVARSNAEQYYRLSAVAERTKEVYREVCGLTLSAPGDSL